MLLFPYPYLSYPYLYWVVSWLSFGCQLFVIWLSIGCHLVDGWLQNGCQLAVSWLSVGCQLAAKWLSIGCHPRMIPDFARYAGKYA